MLIATHNSGKIREYRLLLKGLGNDLIGLDDLGITDDVEETGVSFAENALLKARAFALRSGHVTLADDSGLRGRCPGRTAWRALGALRRPGARQMRNGIACCCASSRACPRTNARHAFSVPLRSYGPTDVVH